MSPRNPKPWPGRAEVRAPKAKKTAGKKKPCFTCAAIDHALQPRKLTSLMNAKGTAWGDADDGGSFRPGPGDSLTFFPPPPNPPLKATRFSARIFVKIASSKSPARLATIVTSFRRVATIQFGELELISNKNGKVTKHRGAQVLLLNTRRLSTPDFKHETAAFAEMLCTGLKLKEVVVELQRNGVAVDSFGVVPD